MSANRPRPSRAIPESAARAAGRGTVALLVLAYAAAALQLHRQSGATPTPRQAARLLLDPNVATAEELALLPRLGPKLSRAIVAYRESVDDPPAFRCAEDLRHVRGIGPRIAEILAPHLRFQPPDPAAQRSGEQNRRD